jgi:collagenase-like PrtC family protease
MAKRSSKKLMVLLNENFSESSLEKIERYLGKVISFVSIDFFSF